MRVVLIIRESAIAWLLLVLHGLDVFIPGLLDLLCGFRINYLDNETSVDDNLVIKLYFGGEGYIDGFLYTHGLGDGLVAFYFCNGHWNCQTHDGSPVINIFS